MFIQEQIGNLESARGSLSLNGMWRVNFKLFPRPTDPPMAKHVYKGNLITKAEPLKKLYLDTYVESLKHRSIKAEFGDILKLKTVLLHERFERIRLKKTKPWMLADIGKATKALKINKTSEPTGFINELFHQNIMGADLKQSLVFLMNGIKEHLELPRE